LSPTCSEWIDLTIRHGRICPFDEGAGVAVEYDLTGHLLLPGLINAHDHLEFNLFPRLGNRHYANATEWASDVHRPAEHPVKEHLQVPKRARLLWGGIKNLLSGATTVSHHNPYDPAVFNSGFPVRVPERVGWAHSLEFSKDLLECYRRTPEPWPFIVHAAEGSDECARAEIPQLDHMGVLTQRTVLVHAVAAAAAEVETMKSRGASVVWCPSSNLFTLGRTLSPRMFEAGVPIVLGTDSAMTAEGDLIDEMQVARATGRLSAERLYAMVTTDAARALRLADGQGTIQPGGVADFVAVEDRGQTPAEALEHFHPEVTFVRGQLALASDHFAGRANDLDTRGMEPLHMEGRGHWLVRAPVAQLLALASDALGSDVRLAGRRISA
jgi:cytosine/adenosine deaminase-related metal-dependent hydrolase